MCVCVCASLCWKGYVVDYGGQRHKDAPGAEVTGSCRYWKPHSSPLLEQHTLLTTEPTLQT